MPTTQRDSHWAQSPRARPYQHVVPPQGAGAAPQMLLRSMAATASMDPGPVAARRSLTMCRHWAQQTSAGVALSARTEDHRRRYPSTPAQDRTHRAQYL